LLIRRFRTTGNIYRKNSRVSFTFFTETFFNQFGNIKDYPVFKPSGNPISFLTDNELSKVKAVYLKILAEIESDYFYKYDAIRPLVFELIHLAQKMQPATGLYFN